MNATAHPVHHSGHHGGHHLGHGWAVTGIVGTIAAIAVAVVLTMVLSQSRTTDPGPGGSTTVLHGSTRDRAGVPGPCFMRPARWSEDAAGPVPRCGD